MDNFADSERMNLDLLLHALAVFCLTSMKHISVCAQAHAAPPVARAPSTYP